MTGIAEDQFPMDRFDIFNVRAEGYDQRLPMLETAVRHYHPDLVILDGIRDLVADINDGIVAQACLERLMHLASDERCCIVCILHQNKSVEDRNLRGWIGTELKNKAFEVYECSKSSERIFTWGQTDTRKYDILDTLKFAVGNDGIPYLCSEEQLKEALFQAQKKVAEDRQSTTKTLAPFNPKYVKGKEGRKTLFDLPSLFKAVMDDGVEYDDGNLRTKLSLESNIVTDHVLSEHCLFGLHQISESEQKPIGIVESERSAVLLSELCPELIWLAYIYGCNLNVNSFEPLQGRKITLFPRTDSVKETYLSFLELADQVKRCYKDIDISVSRFLEDNANDDQKRREIDLLQYLLE